MLNIQHVTDAIHHYHRNKGFIKRILNSSHLAIRATETYLQALQKNKDLISDADLLTINRFFLLDHPVQPGKAAYETWRFINYHYFCDLNAVSIAQLAPLTHCDNASVQRSPEDFSKLALAQLDKRSNAKKMREFFKVLRLAYQQNNLTEDGFVALSKLCIEEMLSQDYANLIQQNKQANFLAECLIMMKHHDILTHDNQQTLIDFAYLQPLHRTMVCLARIGILTQKNFSVISADNNHQWLLALEEMPEDLITPGVWEGLLNLLRNNGITDFKKDIEAYTEMLRQDITGEQMEEVHLEKLNLVSEEGPARQNIASTSHMFLVSPVKLPELIEETSAKINLVP